MIKKISNGRQVFRYEEVASRLMNAIDEGLYYPGQQLPTENELADEYGVTRRTLRKALDIVEENGIISREKGRGTFVSSPAVAHGPVRPRSLLYIGDYQGHLYKDVYCAITEECQHHDYSVIPFNPELISSESERKQKLKALLSETDQAIFCGWGFDSWTPECKAFAPVRINLGTQPMVDRCYYINLDTLHAAELATTHLIDLGHRSIAYIGSAPDHSKDGLVPFLPPVPELGPYAGYCLAMNKAALPLGPSYGFYGDIAQSETLAKPFLQHCLNDITAIVCETDFRAVGVFHALNSLGINVPRDISLVGIGNTPWSEAVSPTMTSVSFNEKEAARLAVMLCQQPVPLEPVSFSVSPKLIARNTTNVLTGVEK